MRTREARARAEEALVRFALLAGDHAKDFVVIGGLNPDFLAPNPPAPHLGTTDVDLLFELGFVYDRDDLDFGWLDEALESGSFHPRDDAGWQWDAILGETHVRLDLLCDVTDNRGQPVYLPGAERATAQNLDGPAAALTDTVLRALTVPNSIRNDHAGAPENVELRFTSLGGYLSAKAAALVSRGKAKDAYDLMFVALYNPGGAPAAAAAVAALDAPVHRAPPQEVVKTAMKMMTSEDGVWAGHFAAQMQLAGDDESAAQLRQDAAAGARRFLKEIGRADQA